MGYLMLLENLQEVQFHQKNRHINVRKHFQKVLMVESNVESDKIGLVMDEET